jgi:protoheme IX farnesyltransferase
VSRIEAGARPLAPAAAQSAPAASAASAASAALAALSDWAVLAKLKIGVMVALAAFTSGLLAAGPHSGLGAGVAPALEAALYIGLVAAASGVFNQVLERDVDARMPRTMRRPLVTGRIRTRDAVLFGALLAAAGTSALAVRFDVLAALLGLATLLAYVLVYTPLKRLSSFNTTVGAIPGAMPPLIGYVALAGEPGPWAWMLFAVLFVWQFPHFLAIAWLYRDDYRLGGMRMLPALPDSAGLAGRQSLVYAVALLPVSLLPALRGEAGIVYAAGALLLGGGYALSAALFAHRETTARARAVLFTSLAYLPLLFSLVLLDPAVSRAFAS